MCREVSKYVTSILHKVVEKLIRKRKKWGPHILRLSRWFISFVSLIRLSRSFVSFVCSSRSSSRSFVRRFCPSIGIHPETQHPDTLSAHKYSRLVRSFVVNSCEFIHTYVSSACVFYYNWLISRDYRWQPRPFKTTL